MRSLESHHKAGRIVDEQHASNAFEAEHMQLVLGQIRHLYLSLQLQPLDAVTDVQQESLFTFTPLQYSRHRTKTRGRTVACPPLSVKILPIHMIVESKSVA